MSKFVILHKKKDTLNRSCCIMKVPKQTLQHLRKKVPLANTIHHSTFVYNSFKKLNLCFFHRLLGRETYTMIQWNIQMMLHSNNSSLFIIFEKPPFVERYSVPHSTGKSGYLIQLSLRLHIKNSVHRLLLNPFFRIFLKIESK